MEITAKPLNFKEDADSIRQWFESDEEYESWSKKQSDALKKGFEEYLWKRVTAL